MNTVGHTRNKFKNNTIINNSNYGIYFSGASSKNNTFCNNFLNNTNNVYIAAGASNFWNTTLNCSAGLNIRGGNCIGGNYWANYSGTGFWDGCHHNRNHDVDVLSVRMQITASCRYSSSLHPRWYLAPPAQELSPGKVDEFP